MANERVHDRVVPRSGSRSGSRSGGRFCATSGGVAERVRGLAAFGLVVLVLAGCAFGTAGLFVGAAHAAGHGAATNSTCQALAAALNLDPSTCAPPQAAVSQGAPSSGIGATPPQALATGQGMGQGTGQGTQMAPQVLGQGNRMQTPTTPVPAGVAPATTIATAVLPVQTAMNATALPAPSGMAPGNVMFGTPLPGGGAGIRGSVPDHRIYFPQGSNILVQEYKAQLDLLSGVLRTEALAGTCLKLVGHSDSEGAFEANRKLSMKRAQTVQAYLLERLHGANIRILIEGMGEEQPLPGLSPADPKNRRVEMLAKRCM